MGMAETGCGRLADILVGFCLCHDLCHGGDKLHSGWLLSATKVAETGCGCLATFLFASVFATGSCLCYRGGGDRLRSFVARACFWDVVRFMCIFMKLDPLEAPAQFVSGVFTRSIMRRLECEFFDSDFIERIDNARCGNLEHVHRPDQARGCAAVCEEDSDFLHKELESIKAAEQQFALSCKNIFAETAA